MANGDVISGCSAVSGITLPSYVIIKKVELTYTPDNLESGDKDGKFYGGKTKKTRVGITITGELLEGGKSGIVALKNTGSGTAAAPRVTNVKVADDSEVQPDFTLEAFYVDNTQSVFLFS